MPSKHIQYSIISIPFSSIHKKADIKKALLDKYLIGLPKAKN